MKEVLIFWFTGLSGAGKTTIAGSAKDMLKAKGYNVLVLDGDDVRARFNDDLGFSGQDIKKNNIRIANLCNFLRKDFDIIIVPIISPYEDSREKAKEIIGDGFYQVFIDADIECVMDRDVKGLYAKAARGEIDNMIGFSPGSPYEVPENPDLVIRTGSKNCEDSVTEFMDFVNMCMKKRNCNKMILAVVSDKEQFAALQEEQIDLSGVQIVCDNPRLYSFLEERHEDVYLLDEFVISEEKRKEINSWGCNSAAAFIKIAKENKKFYNIDVASCIFLKLGYILVQMRKNKAYAEYIVDKFSPEKMIVFKFKEYPQYPTFSGNIFINEFLSDMCETKNINVRYLQVRFKKDNFLNGMISKKARVVASLREISRVIVDHIYGKMVKVKTSTRILVRGAKKHLMPVVHEVKKRGEAIALYDNYFQFKIFDLARREGIPYYIDSSFKYTSKINKKEASLKLLNELKEVVDIAVKNGVFYSEDVNLNDLVTKSLFNSMNTFCESLIEQKEKWENIFVSCNMKSLLLDEDTTTESAFASSICASRGIKSFCVSHATMPVNFSVNQANKIFGNSVTFVNSDFEKHMYEARGWDGNKIKPIGVPRFDRLVSKCRKKESIQKHNSDLIKLFYCGASMKQYWPERGGYLGIHITNYGDAQRNAIRTFLKAASGLPVELIAKPHNYEGEAWERFFQNEMIDMPVKVEAYNSDFYKILGSCDVMILSHWSTAIIEAILCDKPVVLFDPFNSEELVPYSDIGCFRIARNEEDLRCILAEFCENIINGKGVDIIRNNDVYVCDRARKYILGEMDGENTVRVADFIERELNSLA